MIGVYTVLLHGKNFQLFSTEGIIADQEKNLIIFTVLLGCTIVIPVIIMTFAIAWHYREGNTKAAYRPEWSGSLVAESIWWIIPTIIIGILAVVIYQSSHALDPFKELSSSTKPVRIQVVALEWRWLFIYPDEKVASINYVKFPVDTPVNFTITSDAPMNAFWIPQLSGQVYAMSGMSTQLHLAARTPGDYRGSSANISGLGFAGMNFTASAVSKDEFTTWTDLLRSGSKPLDKEVYKGLAQKTCDTTKYQFKLTDPNLYNEVINKYMDPNAALGTTGGNDASSEGSEPKNCMNKTIVSSVLEGEQ